MCDVIVVTQSLVHPRLLNVCFKNVFAIATADSHLELPCLLETRTEQFHYVTKHDCRTTGSSR